MWSVCVSVKRLPPAHWQLHSGFQAEFNAKIIRGDISYPINKRSFCNVADKAKHQFNLQAL